METHHIGRAIIQARKEGHKGVRGFVGGWKEHTEYSKLLSEGKLETFTQDGVLLMRKPKTEIFEGL